MIEGNPGDLRGTSGGPLGISGDLWGPLGTTGDVEQRKNHYDEFDFLHKNNDLGGFLGESLPRQTLNLNGGERAMEGHARASFHNQAASGY